MVCSCLGAFGHPLGFALQPQGETFLLTDAVTAPSPCSAGEGGEEEGWAALAPSLRLCRQLALSLEGSGVTVAFGWVNLGVTCCSAEALPVPGHRAACRQRVQPCLLPGPGGQQPSHRPLELSKALQRRWGDGNGRILPAAWPRLGTGAGGGGSAIAGIAASAHFCPSCLRRSCPVAASPSSPPWQPPCPTPAAGPGSTRRRDICSLPRAPRQRRGGSPRELMLQMMPLVCQLLNPAQAPAEVRLNSGNCTNMVLFLPRAKPCSSCITLGHFLKPRLARSRAGLVQRRAARAGLALLAPVPPRCRQPGAPSCSNPGPSGSCLVMGVRRWRVWMLRVVGVPPRKGSVGGCSREAEAAAGWDGGWGEPGQSEAPARFSFGRLGGVASGGSRSQGD